MSTSDQIADSAKTDLKYVFDRVDNQIRIEMDLIGQRATALCISQSFLVGAFVNVVRADPKDSEFTSFRADLVLTLPIIGLLISVILGAALHAAGAAIKKRKQQRERVKQRLQDALKGTGLADEDLLAHVSLKSWPHWLGQSLVLMAWLLSLFWLNMLRLHFTRAVH